MIMLTHISIQNFITIDQCAIDLASGLVTITGDTGAGKSLLIQAIHFALGAKTTWTHSSDQPTIVSLVFDLQHCPEGQQQLEDAGIPYEDNTCIITRNTNPKKKNSYRVNHSPCTRSQIQSLAEILIHVHGQHATFALLKNNQQRKMLDQMIDHDLLKATSEHFQLWQHSQKQLEQLQAQEAQQSQQMALLRYQLEELGEVNCQQSHAISIDHMLKRMNQADEIIAVCEQACHQIKGEDTYALLPKITQLKHNLDKRLSSIEEAKEASALLDQGATMVHEAYDILESIRNNTEHDPATMQALDDELGMLHQLARKHQVSIEELETREKYLQEELQQFENNQQQLSDLENTVTQEAKAYKAAAKALSHARKEAIPTLEKKVMHNMQALNFLQAAITIELSSQEEQFSHEGYDQINFLIATNPGHEPAPMNKIASGGELSRISLALQLSLMSDHDQATLIFDEVDVGISGKTAAMVGEQLYSLGCQRQVICITHLAQVAAQGHQHLQVRKQAEKSSTSTFITSLNHDDRIMEIARIIGGIELDDSSTEHAKKLLSKHPPIAPSEDIC